MSESEMRLVSRVVDRHDAPADWEALHRLAADDADVWRRVALSLQDDCALRTDLGAALADVDGVDLPPAVAPAPAPAPVTPSASTGGPRRDRRERAAAAMGWAAALFLSLAWWLNAGQADPRDVIPASAPSMASSSAVAPLLDGALPVVAAPVDAGAPLAVDAFLGSPAAETPATAGDDALVVEFPKQLLETRTLPDGQVEVLYIRRLVEREVVDGAWALGEDDLGRVQPVPIDLAALTPSELL